MARLNQPAELGSRPPSVALGELAIAAGLDADAKKRGVEAGKIKGKIEKDQDGNDRVHFTDTTENLTKFVSEAGDDLFSKDALKLERLK